LLVRAHGRAHIMPPPRVPRRRLAVSWGAAAHARAPTSARTLHRRAHRAAHLKARVKCCLGRRGRAPRARPAAVAARQSWRLHLETKLASTAADTQASSLHCACLSAPNPCSSCSTALAGTARINTLVRLPPVAAAAFSALLGGVPGHRGVHTLRLLLYISWHKCARSRLLCAVGQGGGGARCLRVRAWRVAAFRPRSAGRELGTCTPQVQRRTHQVCSFPAAVGLRRTSCSQRARVHGLRGWRCVCGVGHAGRCRVVEQPSALTVGRRRVAFQGHQLAIRLRARSLQRCFSRQRAAPQAHGLTAAAYAHVLLRGGVQVAVLLYAGRQTRRRASG
jgi:hypothetical protein